MTDTTHQEALRERLEVLSSLLPGVAYLRRQEADGHFSVPYASDGVAAMFELTPEAVVADASAVIAKIHPDDLGPYLASIAASQRTSSLSEHPRSRSTRDVDRWRDENQRPAADCEPPRRNCDARSVRHASMLPR